MLHLRQGLPERQDMGTIEQCHWHAHRLRVRHERICHHCHIIRGEAERFKIQVSGFRIQKSILVAVRYLATLQQMQTQGHEITYLILIGNFTFG